MTPHTHSSVFVTALSYSRTHAQPVSVLIQALLSCVFRLMDPNRSSAYNDKTHDAYLRVNQWSTKTVMAHLKMNSHLKGIVCEEGKEEHVFLKCCTSTTAIGLHCTSRPTTFLGLSGMEFQIEIIFNPNSAKRSIFLTIQVIFNQYLYHSISNFQPQQGTRSHSNSAWNQRHF